MPDRDTVLAELFSALSVGSFSTAADVLNQYAVDQGPVLDLQQPMAVVFPRSVAEVQTVVKWAARHQVVLIPRGAGTGVSGGAHATAGSVVLSLERMNRILEIHPEDEVAVVEPGVVNADLNAAVEPFGLMYAPDPASYRLSTIGGNVATNAGGLRCAKYGVTRDSLLALDVVLADGSLIHTGHRTFKGVAGFDLTGLFTGSEGVLGIVVGATVRLKYLPVQTRTLAVFFEDFRTAAAGVLAVGRARVQPAIMELLDGASLADIDARMDSALRSRGGALLLIQTDGLAADLEAAEVVRAVAGLGGRVFDEDPEEAARLLELRRHSRGMDADLETRVGEDVAVPRSRLVDYIAATEELALRQQVNVRVVAHAGDGNLHPTFWIAEADPNGIRRLNDALDESVEIALSMGGTITGEHGVGQFKLRWLGLEQSPELIGLQRRIKELFDPQGIFNPGKAV
ncbi:FAD-binding oxidoreductase [Arthrobacter russicus]|uniref:Glycolate oxidase n=1 Tax=Arthrobacter russicus TaxID=172040 RepID=A0ABU1JAZ4_9MICC|nr:FAD-linked oxidase C-terminal domain-containing protein [Arthrobacter russicus]MDN5669435.1 FAD-binding protein [Renibacterium salmoninarum]MDR6269305.1 glycolate oxidase [Arthrobacter russicus]